MATVDLSSLGTVAHGGLFVYPTEAPVYSTATLPVGVGQETSDYHGDQDSRSATPQGRRHPGEADRQPILSSVRRGGRSTHDPGRENSSAWRILGRSLFIGGMAPLYPQPKESISMGRLTEAFDYTNLAVQAVCVRQGVYLARSQRSSLRVGLNDNRWENKCVTNLSHLRCWRSPACVADAHSP